MAESDDDIIRVFLLDDHEVVRRGVAEMVNAQADMEVVGEANRLIRKTAEKNMAPSL